MKILIVFESLTGNTKEIARAIKQSLKNDHKTKLLNVTDVLEGIGDFDADLYFLGSWTNKGKSGNLMREFAGSLKDKNVAIFGTAGYGGSKEYYRTLIDRFSEDLDDSNSVIGGFYCKGRMREMVKERYITLIQEHPDDKNLEVSLRNFEEAAKHPNQSDLINAGEFALEIVNSLKVQ